MQSFNNSSLREFPEKLNEEVTLERIPFKNGSYLELDTHQKEEELRIIGRNGKIELSIRITDAGPVLCFEAASVQLKATEKIALKSKNISLEAEENINIVSEGNLSRIVKGDLVAKTDGDVTDEARIQNIIADLGNVNIKANDDVRLDGERIKLNCTD